MQYLFSTRMAGLLACVFLAGKALAVDTTKMWSETDDYVKLEAVNAENAHPVVFSTEQLSNLLQRVFKRVDGKTPQPYYNDDEIKRLSEALLPVFAKAGRGDDVQFVTSYRPGGMFFIPRVLNAGRMFVENGKLNVLVGMCGDSLDMAYYHVTGVKRSINHGSRIKPSANLGCTLLSGNGAVSVNSRPDWISIDIAAALASTPDKTYHPVPGSDPGTTFQPATATTTFQPVTAPVSKPSPTVQATPPAPQAAPQPAPAAAPSSKAEERLTVLKRLKDGGLISDSEYEQKRAAVLKDL
ncbi:SHOCT domain-containing protein [Chitinimonas sp. PSY-7]|uniref:SHOCT domain-containing protein n=1 Tax=Chitinimonas sp. PSY-7 TaxID=3459088 RepID=UPI0040403924